MPIDTGDTTWMPISTGLVMMMTPALGFGGTVIIMKILDRTIGLKVKEEDIGLDLTQYAERAYVN